MGCVLRTLALTTKGYNPWTELMVEDTEPKLVLTPTQTAMGVVESIPETFPLFKSARV